MSETRQSFPAHGWLGLGLAGLFWVLNWTLPGVRTNWGFFPLWLGYCLFMDGLVYARSGTSLLTRSLPRYLGLFVVSAPAWWLFEALNLRTQNWVYVGTQGFSPAAYAFWTTLSFTTVLPAVLESAELFAGFGFVRRLKGGPVIGAHPRTVLLYFLTGWLMLGLLLAWPQVFFLFNWTSLYFILEPLNVWLGNRSLVDWTRRGDWRPVIALWLGVLLTAFFWEMWNYLSFPRWVYHISWGDWLHVFEMPLLGYGGYLPFALELTAIYHLVTGLPGRREGSYLRLVVEE